MAHCCSVDSKWVNLLTTFMQGHFIGDAERVRMPFRARGHLLKSQTPLDNGTVPLPALHLGTHSSAMINNPAPAADNYSNLYVSACM